MRAIKDLPENYKKSLTIDIEKDKRLALIVNGISFAIFVIMAVIMCFFVPAFQLVMPQEGEGHFAALPRVGVLFVGLLAYIILHELTHGVAMKLFGASKINYGFTGLYAYAGSDSYFDKKSFIIISLSPIVIWGVILTIINLLVPYNWIWTIYFIQLVNVAGAAGDFYVTFKLLKMDDSVLVYDEGVGMAIYTIQAEDGADASQAEDTSAAQDSLSQASDSDNRDTSNEN